MLTVRKDPVAISGLLMLSSWPCVNSGCHLFHSFLVHCFLPFRLCFYKKMALTSEKQSREKCILFIKLYIMKYFSQKYSIIIITVAKLQDIPGTLWVYYISPGLYFTIVLWYVIFTIKINRNSQTTSSSLKYFSLSYGECSHSKLHGGMFVWNFSALLPAALSHWHF